MNQIQLIEQFKIERNLRDLINTLIKFKFLNNLKLKEILKSFAQTMKRTKILDQFIIVRNS
jgi:hypothetical protein